MEGSAYFLFAKVAFWANENEHIGSWLKLCVKLLFVLLVAVGYESLGFLCSCDKLLKSAKFIQYRKKWILGLLARRHDDFVEAVDVDLFALRVSAE